VEPLFVNRVGKPLNRDKFRETVIRPALIAAGLPPGTRTYDLRHAHASMLVDLGANVLAVAQRMGHSDATVTLREYGHLFAGVQERLGEQLEELRAGRLRPRPVTSFRSLYGTPQDAHRTHQDAKTRSEEGLSGQVQRSKNPL
jgi:Phage integrase family